MGADPKVSCGDTWSRVFSGARATQAAGPPPDAFADIIVYLMQGRRAPVLGGQGSPGGGGVGQAISLRPLALDRPYGGRVDAR